MYLQGFPIDSCTLTYDNIRFLHGTATYSYAVGFFPVCQIHVIKFMCTVSSLHFTAVHLHAGNICYKLHAVDIHWLYLWVWRVGPVHHQIRLSRESSLPLISNNTCMYTVSSLGPLPGSSYNKECAWGLGMRLHTEYVMSSLIPRPPQHLSGGGSKGSTPLGMYRLRHQVSFMSARWWSMHTSKTFTSPSPAPFSSLLFPWPEVVKPINVTINIFAQ